VIALSILVGCDLHKDSNDCVTEPGLTTGGATVCTQPPPPQFSKLGQ
jgi:hypothetical protein